jgi:eukaryotic-like serine/threonine-protein kinase
MAQQQQRYRIIERIAAGGMAEVYRAESAGVEGFKKIVAIKRVLPHLAEKKQFIGMFLDEARTSAALSHSNCVQTFDIGVGDNTYFIVMEYVDGADLKALIEHRRQFGQRVPTEAACYICLKICEGLAYAHEARDASGQVLGIVHRDMSPPNVLITRNGEVKIVDFGLAKANSQLEESEPGIIKGKFSYLSPEAARGESVDARTDVFAVGIMLWEMLAGRRLFLGETDLETVRQVQAAQVPGLRQFNPEVSPELERVVLKALAKVANHRYSTARDLGRDLTTIMFAGRPVSSFDISELVQEVVAQREVEKRRKKAADKVSIIGSLIEEAMLEFTSLDVADGPSKDGTTQGSVVTDLGSAPLNVGSFGKPQDWGRDLGLGGSSPARGAIGDETEFEVGNLAALEEDSGDEPDYSGDDDSDGTDSEAPPPPASSERGSADVGEATESGSGAGGLILMIVLFVAAAGAAGAYFGGLIP